MNKEDTSPKDLIINNKKEKKPKEPSVSIWKLFRFSTIPERTMIILAMIFSAGAGALQPISILMYGSYITNLTGSLTDTSKLLENTLPVIHIIVYIGTAALVAAYISTCLWVLTGESQTRRIRSMYLHSVLKQDMEWFDKSEDGSLNTRLASDTQRIQDGISEKFGLFISFTAQFIGGFVVAFIKGWKMSLIMLVMIPLLAGAGGAMGHFMTKYAKDSQNAYAEAGLVAEQAFQSIRTIYSFSLQSRFLKRYNHKLEAACDAGIKSGVSLGIGFAFFMFFMFGSFGLALWFGSSLVTKGEINGSSVFVIFMAMTIGCMSFVKLPPNLSAISSACAASYKVYQIIDRVPDIDLDSAEGFSPSSVLGSIEFKNVEFKYPTRPDAPVLNGLSFKVEPGKTVAFVGPSGSGKSTTVQLLQRFYDTLSGDILLDGHNIKNVNVKWLRQQIGVVSQEPVLFNMTIRQNLLMGTHEIVSDEVIIAACKEANCHAFITKLPSGYDTIVGEQGGMLSGGQKQRIAIARAILKNPAILLLDEATSALDTQSERLVQNALDKASANRTTIVVAHRLSTIMNSDLIVVLDHGSIVEMGTHQELIEREGIYADLVQKQKINLKKNNLEDDFDHDAELNEEAVKDLEQQEIIESLQQSGNNNNIQLNANTISSASVHDNEKDHLNFNSDTIDTHKIKIKSQSEAKRALKKQNAPIMRLVKDMRPEWNFLAFGLIGSTIAGCIFPLYAYSFSRVIGILSVPGQNTQLGPLQGTNLYAFIFLIIGLVGFVGNGGQIMAFEVCGVKYTKRLRSKVFNTYMKQEVGFFDQEENNSGSLVAKLAVDAHNVSEMITKVWGDVANLIVSIIVGLIIGFYYSWALALITLGMSPFLMAATAYEFYLQRGFEDSTKSANAQSGQVAGEAIREVRTVASLNKQYHFEERYFQATDRPHKLAVRKAYLSSIGAACHKGISIYTNALAFYAGARLITNGSLDFQHMFTSMTVIMVTADAAGRTSTFAATYSKAKVAALTIFDILDRETKIDPDMEGAEPSSVDIDGNVSFDKVKFAYPARPDNLIFDGNLNLHGTAGQTIALVGPSGCGKSTTIGMIQRWYDSLDGDVSLDNKNVKSYSLYNLRSHMALVGQEPVLFDMTIGENVRFGIVDGKEVSQEEVENACKASNIHPFISDLPEGYNTRVGDKGSQISGGQKQRIAIARALIRRPRLLLLDEATSALDSDSERIVQKALDNIIEQGGRTTITIAHRLSTIQNADMICVVKDGCVVEQGTHWELLQLNGIYSDMVHQQNLNIL